MDIMIQWFWILKLLVLIALLFSTYKMVESGFKAKYWIAMFFISLILVVISPIKLTNADSRKLQTQTNACINATKELPPRIIDESYSKRKLNLGIKEKDLP